MSRVTVELDRILKPLISDRITRRDAIKVIVLSCDVTASRPPDDVQMLLAEGKSRPVSLAALRPRQSRGREQLRRIANGLATFADAVQAATPEIRDHLSRSVTSAVPDVLRDDRNGVVELLRELVSQVADGRVAMARGETLRVRQALRLALALILSAPEADAKATALRIFPSARSFEIDATWTFDPNSPEAQAIGTAFGGPQPSGPFDITSAVNLSLPRSRRASPLDILVVLRALRLMCQEQIDRINAQVPATDAQLHHVLRLATVAAVFKHHGLRTGTGTGSPFVDACHAIGVSRKFIRAWFAKLDIDRFVLALYGEPSASRLASEIKRPLFDS